jgi:hypothetical protein
MQVLGRVHFHAEINISLRWSGLFSALEGLLPSAKSQYYLDYCLYKRENLGRSSLQLCLSHLEGLLFLLETILKQGRE